MAIKQVDAERVAAVLVDRYGLDLSGVAGEDDEGIFVDLRVKELHENEGFLIRVRFEWRRITALFLPGQWSAGLLAEMGSAEEQKRLTFTALARALAGVGGEISLLVNGIKCDAFDPREWPRYWKQLQLTVVRGPIVIDLDNIGEVREAVLTWGGGLLGMAASLLPLEEIAPVAEADVRGLPEGAKVRIEVNRFERSRLNRALCISIHGTACLACGLELRAVYGELGDNYIHVHHVTPISKIREGYAVNPATDLVPLCPNCHAMVHRRDPPLTPEELRAVLKGTKGSN